MWSIGHGAFREQIRCNMEANFRSGVDEDQRRMETVRRSTCVFNHAVEGSRRGYKNAGDTHPTVYLFLAQYRRTGRASWSGLLLVFREPVRMIRSHLGGRSCTDHLQIIYI